ncbi:hypothetical protein B0H11DRAFT_1898141 [Mycena galericulata]|nr:hypothetical protein B0H11DRAFT_1898141 [Mycena galericulata]
MVVWLCLDLFLLSLSCFSSSVMHTVATHRDSQFACTLASVLAASPRELGKKSMRRIKTTKKLARRPGPPAASLYCDALSMRTLPAASHAVQYAGAVRHPGCAEILNVPYRLRRMYVLGRSSRARRSSCWWTTSSSRMGWSAVLVLLDPAAASTLLRLCTKDPNYFRFAYWKQTVGEFMEESSMHMVDKFGAERIRRGWWTRRTAAVPHVQDTANRGGNSRSWRGTALLDRYSQERLPVIAASALHGQIVHAVAENGNGRGGADEDGDGAWKRGDAVGMLGVDAQGCAIVLAEDGSGAEVGVTRVMRAYGEAEVGGGGGACKAGVPRASFIRLLEVFGPDADTALVFDGNAETEEVAVAGALGRWPEGTAYVGRRRPEGSDAEAGTVIGTWEAVDREGYAYAAYADWCWLTGQGLRIVIVRPDGMLGSVVKGVERG